MTLIETIKAVTGPNNTERSVWPSYLSAVVCE